MLTFSSSEVAIGLELQAYYLLPCACIDMSSGYIYLYLLIITMSVLSVVSFFCADCETDIKVFEIAPKYKQKNSRILEICGVRKARNVTL
jgi:hypothetical protein